MSIGIVTSRTRRQYLRPPTGPWALNRESPQARGLVAWWPLNEGLRSPRDLAGRWPLTTTGTMAPAGGPDGGLAVSNTGSSANYLEHQGTPCVTAVPLTMSSWFWAADVTTYYALVAVMKFANAGTDDYFSLGINGAGAGDPVFAEVANGANYNGASSSVGYAANTWSLAHGGFDSATSRWAMCNGKGRGTNTTSRTPVAASLDRTQLASFVSQGGTFSPINGRIADARVRNVSWSEAEAWAEYDPRTRWELYYPVGRRTWAIPDATSPPPPPPTAARSYGFVIG